MASVGVTRKLFIDSRYKVSGTNVDFLIELPVDVDCTRTSSFFVASCSFANTFATVTTENNKFYYFVELNAQTQFTLFVSTIPPGAYDPVGFANAIFQATPELNKNEGTVTWNPNTGTYTIDFNSRGQNVFAFMLPDPVDIDYFVGLYTRPGVPWTFNVHDNATQQDIPFPVYDKQQTVNALLNLPSVKNSVVYNWHRRSRAHSRGLHPLVAGEQQDAARQRCQGLHLQGAHRRGLRPGRAVPLPRTDGRHLVLRLALPND